MRFGGLQARLADFCLQGFWGGVELDESRKRNGGIIALAISPRIYRGRR
jgi:hypothetical protein